MAKRKSAAIVMVPDGAGGMTEVTDRRFEKRPAVYMRVAAEQADAWLKYLGVECTRRGWGLSNIGQLGADENSGTFSVNAGPLGQIAIVWERKRNGPMHLRGSSAGAPEIVSGDIKAFLDDVDALCQAGAKEKFRRLGLLHYEGLAWRGEIRLDHYVRLCPPSQQYEDALLGPRVVVVEAQIEGIDAMDATGAFSVGLRELSVFLTVVMGAAVRVSPMGPHQSWTWELQGDGHAETSVRQLGYVEKLVPKESETDPGVHAVPLEAVGRPDFALHGIDGTRTEQWLPDDIHALWEVFKGLPADRRQQFLEVGTIWQLALSLGHDYPTASYALNVVACEALKPRTPESRDHNVYDVVEALLGSPTADYLRRKDVRPQAIRNAHLLTGELRGNEFAEIMMLSSFQDPTFMLQAGAMRQITQAAIIEWLRHSGAMTMPKSTQRLLGWQSWVTDRAVYLLPAALLLGFVVGIAFG